MTLVFLIWFAGIVEGLKAALGILAGLIFLGVSTVKLWQVLNNDDPLKLKNRVYILFVFCMGLSVVLPSEKTVYYMGAAYLGVEAVQSNVGKKVVSVIEMKIDEYIAEGQQAKKKEAK